MSAMPRKRRLAVKMSPGAMGQKETLRPLSDGWERGVILSCQRDVPNSCEF
jgi:hypothetical protein